MQRKSPTGGTRRRQRERAHYLGNPPDQEPKGQVLTSGGGGGGRARIRERFKIFHIIKQNTAKGSKTQRRVAIAKLLLKEERKKQKDYIKSLQKIKNRCFTQNSGSGYTR